MSCKYFTEDAVRLIAETNPSQPTSVSVTLTEPAGTALLTDQAMTYDSTNKYWYYDWQPTSGGHGEGKYTYKVKAVNGSYTNYAKHYFYMETI